LRGGTRAEVLKHNIIDERINAYLLGELPEEEAERFEDECFAGENWPGQLNLAEEDLIDEYLRGALTPERRRRFEENYLTTDARVERVRMAAALLRHVDSHATSADASRVVSANAARVTSFKPPKESRRESWFGALWGGRTFVPRAALSFALLLIVVAGAFMIYRLTAPSSRAIVLVALTPTNAERGAGAEPTKVNLPSDAGALRVSLTLPEGVTPSARYRVELDDGEGKTESLEAEGHDARTVSVSIPASRLARGTYALRLYALTAESVEQRVKGSYLFSVE
jgi:anti-sigma factor RsiW